MRHGERHRLASSRMTEQRLVNLTRSYFFSTAIDEFLEPAGDEEIPIGVEAALIARAEPAVAKRVRIGLRIVLVSAGDIRPPDDDLASAPVLQQPAGFVHDRQIGSGGRSD